MTVAVEAAESGSEVLLIEKSPQLGGNVARLHQYFPKLNSPESGMEMHFRRLRANNRVRALTHTEAVGIRGEKGDFQVDLHISPRYVNDGCTMCDKCAQACPVEIDDRFNYSMGKVKAAHMPGSGGFPAKYIIEHSACRKESCGKCLEVCADKAIDFSATPVNVTVRAGSVVMATGWEPYDASLLSAYGFGKVPNVINSVMLERLFAPGGPTGGRLLRPSDGKEAKNIAFVQCAGQLDESHLPYCSKVCCLASIKHAHFVTGHYPDASVNIIYTELFNPNPARYTDFISRVSGDSRVGFVMGKVDGVRGADDGGDVILSVREPGGVRLKEIRADLAVLAVGMVPSGASKGLDGALVRDRHGFIPPEHQQAGIYVAGSAKCPGDVTASVLDAAHTALRVSQKLRQ